MKELHLTDNGWVPVDIPPPPVCYESTTGPHVPADQAMDKFTRAITSYTQARRDGASPRPGTGCHKAGQGLTTRQGGKKRVRPPKGAGGTIHIARPILYMVEMNSGHRQLFLI